MGVAWSNFRNRDEDSYEMKLTLSIVCAFEWFCNHFFSHGAGNAALNNGTAYYHTYFNNAKIVSLSARDDFYTQHIYMKKKKRCEERKKKINPRFNFSVNCAFLFILFSFIHNYTYVIFIYGQTKVLPVFLHSTTKWWMLTDRKLPFEVEKKGCYHTQDF